MNTKPKDTFFDNYAFGTIASPDNIETDELLAWFRDHDIVAGVARTSDNHTYEFYVPMFENPFIEDKTLVGTVTPDGDLDFKLLSDQFALELANDFSADVYMDSASYDFADWSDEPREGLTRKTNTYIISKAPPESAMNYAHTIKQTVEYARLNKFSLWKSKDYGAWYDYGFMPRELPAFIFVDGFLMIQYKAMSDPIHLYPTDRIKMSYHEIPDASWEGNRAGVAMEEISNTQLRPGGGMDTLIRAGILKKSRVEMLLDVLSGDQKDFVAGTCKVFDLPPEIAEHITADTMPEGSQTAKVSGWFKLFSRTIEEYAYEPDPHAGPIKRFYAHISARPLLDWTWMIGELAIGIVMAYYFLISQLSTSQPWWHYLLGVIGVFFIIESLIGMHLAIKRKLRP